jgi:hypothetical protein
LSPTCSRHGASLKSRISFFGIKILPCHSRQSAFGSSDWIDRWATDRRVVGRQLCMHPRKVQHSGDLLARESSGKHHRGRTNRKIALGSPSAAPSSPASAADRKSEGSPFRQTISDFSTKSAHSDALRQRSTLVAFRRSGH